MKDSDKINSAALRIIEAGMDSSYFAAAWTDIYRRMQEIEATRRVAGPCPLCGESGPHSHVSGPLGIT